MDNLELAKLTRDAWIEVDLGKLANNMKEIKRLNKGNSKILAVVKADGHGHGAKYIANTLLENGADAFGVAMLDEALELRKSGIESPILILGYSDPKLAKLIVDNDIEQTVFTIELAKALSLEAQKQNKNINIQINVDTGLTRLGFKANEVSIEEIKEISKLPNLIIKGIWTHFASANRNNKDFTYQQFKRFNDFCNLLEEEGINIELKHCANSPTIIDLPEMHMDVIRPGTILYGLEPSKEVKLDRIKLQEVMSLKAKVAQVKEIGAGESVSYDRKFIATEKTKVATIPVGYADGYSRMLSGKSEVLIHGIKVPLIGLISMDQFMVDVTAIEDVNVGDEVVLFGKQKDSFISINDVANHLSTTNVEIINMINRRLPKVYTKDGKIEKIVNYLVPYEL